ncbi:MAG: glycoside hydrolase family 88 protein [Cyclobacteriaceae bacterium]|nr:glycoside hydrolase family 88 protein [Cyclobacteriaceae bacterium HetDA_MAG_MS6]
MLRLFSAFALILALMTVSCGPQSREENMKPSIEEIIKSSLDRSLIQYKSMYGVLPDTLFPRSLDNEGQLVTNRSPWWTSGFYPGSLWYLYEYSGDETVLEMAQAKTEVLEPEQYNNMDHDIGFKMLCSYGNGIRITGDSSATPILIQSAESLISRFMPNAGVIKSWEGFKEYKYPVIIDNMMNLELLFWASKVSGDPKYREVALSHAKTTLNNHYREDNSSYHVLAYDSDTGEVLAKKTAQGFADESAWARGQAWGLYGYVMTYRESKDPVFLEHAKKIAEFLLDHPNLPEDHIPYWDFDAPDIPDALRDASAAAIIASALIELSGHVDGKVKNKFSVSAERIIRSLSSKQYLAAAGENGNFILKHSVGHKPRNSEMDVPLSYADYYFIEALMRLKNLGAD